MPLSVMALAVAIPGRPGGDDDPISVRQGLPGHGSRARLPAVHGLRLGQAGGRGLLQIRRPCQGDYVRLSAAISFGAIAIDLVSNDVVFLPPN